MCPIKILLFNFSGKDYLGSVGTGEIVLIENKIIVQLYDLNWQEQPAGISKKN